MGQNGFFFRNLHEKLGKKMLWKIFFLGHMGLKYGVKNGPFHQKWSKIVKIEYFSSGKGTNW
jgi:hypothetical protein